MSKPRPNKTPFPTPDQALVLELMRRFPGNLPKPTDSDRQVWISVGERNVVDFLISTLERNTGVKLKTTHVFHLDPKAGSPGDSSASPSSS